MIKTILKDTCKYFVTIMAALLVCAIACSVCFVGILFNNVFVALLGVVFAAAFLTAVIKYYTNNFTKFIRE